MNSRNQRWLLPSMSRKMVWSPKWVQVAWHLALLGLISIIQATVQRRATVLYNGTTDNIVQLLSLSIYSSILVWVSWVYIITNFLRIMVDLHVLDKPFNHYCGLSQVGSQCHGGVNSTWERPQWWLYLSACQVSQLLSQENWL